MAGSGQVREGIQVLVEVAGNDGLHAGQLVGVEAQVDHDGDVCLQQRVALNAGEEDSAVHEVDVVQHAYVHSRAGVLRAVGYQSSLQATKVTVLSRPPPALSAFKRSNAPQ